MWEIEKSEESSRLSLSVSLAPLSELAWSIFPHFHFHPRKEISQSFPTQRFLLFSYPLHFLQSSNLVSHLKISLHWDDVSGCKYFPKASSCCLYTRNILLKKERRTRERADFVGKKLLIFVIQIYDFVHFQSCAAKWQSWLKVEWISCLLFIVAELSLCCCLHVLSTLTIDWFLPIYHWHYHSHIDAIKSIQVALIKHFSREEGNLIIFIDREFSHWKKSRERSGWTERLSHKILFSYFLVHIATSKQASLRICLAAQLMSPTHRLPHSPSPPLCLISSPKNQLFERKHC